jgi:hypothetical protein
LAISPAFVEGAKETDFGVAEARRGAPAAAVDCEARGAFRTSGGSPVFSTDLETARRKGALWSVLASFARAVTTLSVAPSARSCTISVLGRKTA